MSADSDNNSQTKPGTMADPASMVAAFWAQWLEQSTRGTQALLEIMQGVGDPQQIQERQQRWMEIAAESLDSFLRTPPFMELMRRQLKAVTDLKTMQDQVVHGAARHLGMPLADDVFGLFERLHSTEQTILERLQAIENRLQAIEERGRTEPSGSRKRAVND
jgi:transposase